MQGSVSDTSAVSALGSLSKSISSFAYSAAASKGLRRVGKILGLSLAVGFFSYEGLDIYVGLPDHGIWPANGVLLAILLMSERRDWPWYLALNLPVNVATHLAFSFPLSPSIAYSLLNLVEVGLAALLISRKVRGHPDIGNARTLWCIVFYGLIVACGLASALAVWLAPALLHIRATSYFWQWYSSEALGMAIMTPLVLAINEDELYIIASRKKLTETIGLLTFVTVSAVLIFRQNEYPIGFLIFPILLLVMFRLGKTGSAAAVFLVSVPVLYYTLGGRGPLTHVSSSDPGTVIAIMHCFFFVMVGMVYAVAATLGRQQLLQASLKGSEERYRVLAEYSRDIIIRSDLEGYTNYISPAITEIANWLPGELLGRSIRELVHPDYRANFDQTWNNLLSNPTRQVTTYPMWIQTGGYIWVESNARVVCDPVTGQGREVVSIVRDVTSRVAEQQKLLKAYKHVEVLATTEPLTGLANRRRFDEALLNEWRRALCNQTPLSLLMIDIDNFKNYNDHYGHLAGDHCLKTVADTLLRNVFRPEDVIARYGGEEFAILLPNTPAANASEVAERLRAAVERKEMDVKAGLRVHTTISVGVACMQPKVEETPNILVAAADEALYTAKNRGKNCVINGSVASE